VQSARAYRYAIWPGKFCGPADLTREDYGRSLEEYQAQWREESVSWNEFEASVTREYEQVLDISGASLATGQDHTVALRLHAHLNYAVYHEVFIRAERFEISGNDGTRFELEEFLELGEAYWEDFSLRSSAPK